MSQGSSTYEHRQRPAEFRRPDTGARGRRFVLPVGDGPFRREGRERLSRAPDAPDRSCVLSAAGVRRARFLLAAARAVADRARDGARGRRSLGDARLPWDAATHLPVINNALPFRFTAYVSLAAAVIVAQSGRRRREGESSRARTCFPSSPWSALVPAVWRTHYPSFRATDPQRLAFFTDGLYKTCIPQNETVASSRSGPDFSQLAQAETGLLVPARRGRLAGAESSVEPLRRRTDRLRAQLHGRPRQADDGRGCSRSWQPTTSAGWSRPSAAATQPQRRCAASARRSASAG